MVGVWSCDRTMSYKLEYDTTVAGWIEGLQDEKRAWWMWSRSDGSTSSLMFDCLLGLLTLSILSCYRYSVSQNNNKLSLLCIIRVSVFSK